jgi:hypothetical protein
MTRNRRLFVSLMFALMLTVFVTTSAFAHFCINPNKQEGAGSVLTITAITLEDGTIELVSIVPNKKLNATGSNGGFITVILDGTAYDLFAHNLLPDGALASGPDGDNMCDGHGVDYLWACLGVEPPF